MRTEREAKARKERGIEKNRVSDFFAFAEIEVQVRIETRIRTGTKMRTIKVSKEIKLVSF